MALGRVFFKDVSKFVGAAIIVQIIGIITVPIFSRIFSPQVVGSFALFNSLVGILSVFGTGNYESAMMLPPQKEDALDLVFISVLIAFLWAIIIFILVLIFGSKIEYIGEYRRINKYFFLLPIFSFLTCLNRTFVSWCNRNKEFGFNAKVSIFSSLLSKSGNILFGFLGFVTSFSLIIVNLSVAFLESAVRIKIFSFKEKKSVVGALSVKRMQQNIIRYKKFPLISTWSRLIDTGSILIVPIILSLFFDVQEVGLYSQSLTLVQLPIALIASAMGQVLFQRLSEAKYVGELSNITTSSFALLLQVGTPIFTIVFFLGKRIIFIFFR
jgi:O-antigen/teichoic acid export membrane protein